MVTGGKLYEYDPTTEDWVEIETLKDFVTEDTTSVTFIDIDGDGDDDLVVTTGPGKPSIVYENVDGRFPDPPAPIGDETYDAQDVEYVDINNDDIPDLVIGNSDGPDLVYLGTGDPGNPTWGDDPGDDPLEIPGTDGVATKSIEVDDIDGDGDMDVVIAAEKDGYADVVVIFNDGTDPNNRRRKEDGRAADRRRDGAAGRRDGRCGRRRHPRCGDRQRRWARRLPPTVRSSPLRISRGRPMLRLGTRSSRRAISMRRTSTATASPTS